MLNKSSRVWAPCFGMGCKAQTTAIAPLWRGYATLQTAQNRADRAARDLFSVALGDQLLKVAPAWHPNHDDGVQITAAPLWPLFRHKPCDEYSPRMLRGQPRGLRG